MPSEQPEPDVEALLPLSAVSFEILLSLSEGERHGYAILREVESRTEGRIRLYPGTLYRAIARMVADGWIEELEERPIPEVEDERRRYYRLTALGRLVAVAEARRLAGQVRAARARKLLPQTT